MDKYEQDMFDFLTQEENLKGLIIAKNQFDSVKETLLFNLWEKVTNNLKTHFQGSKEWEVRQYKLISDYHSKIYLYDVSLKFDSNGLPPFLFGWERLSKSYPYFGFWINLKTTEYDIESIVDYLIKHKHEIARDFGGPNDEWIFWSRENQLDFEKDNCLINIIPGKVENKAEQMSTLLIQLFTDMQESYKHIKENFRK